MKAGRTHLMDATPVTLGQEFGGYAQAIENGIERVASALPRVGELPLGGTAVGTGINCPAGFASASSPSSPTDMDLPLTEARDHFEAQGARDALVEASGVCRVDRGLAQQDRQRHPLDGQRAERRARRDPHPRSAAGLVDHAGQGEPGRRRGRAAGRGAGDRQRRRGRVVGGDGQLRAQRDAAGDRPQPARVDPPARRGVACVRRRSASTASRPTRSGATGTRRRRRRSAPRSTR